MSQQQQVRCLCVNVGGLAVARMHAVTSRYPDCDLFAFVETRLTASACNDMSVAGYAAHHCVRPEREGVPVSGGITVLIREGSPLLAGGVSVRCDASTGIVWIEVPAREPTLLFTGIRFSHAIPWHICWMAWRRPRHGVSYTTSSWAT